MSTFSELPSLSWLSNEIKTSCCIKILKICQEIEGDAISYCHSINANEFEGEIENAREREKEKERETERETNKQENSLERAISYSISRQISVSLLSKTLS